MSQDASKREVAEQGISKEMGHLVALFVIGAVKDYCANGFIKYQGQELTPQEYINLRTAHRGDGSFYMEMFGKSIKKDDAEHGMDRFMKLSDEADRVFAQAWSPALIAEVQEMGVKNRGRLNELNSQLKSYRSFNSQPSYQAGIS